MDKPTEPANHLQERLVTIDLNKLRPDPMRVSMNKMGIGALYFFVYLFASGAVLKWQWSSHQWSDWQTYAVLAFSVLGFWLGYRGTTPEEKAFEILSKTDTQNYEAHIRDSIAGMYMKLTCAIGILVLAWLTH